MIREFCAFIWEAASFFRLMVIPKVKKTSATAVKAKVR